MGDMPLASPIDILCRVVDNYGDIGVVWRLAKSLQFHSPQSDIRIIVDNLDAFATLQPGLAPQAHCQKWLSFTVVSEQNPGDFVDMSRAVLCIEAFACGRADWYERLLFDATSTQKRLHVIFEYLTAEPYAAEFHLLPSLSPSHSVKKIFFMPGFTPGTGGLILDPSFSRARTDWNSARPLLGTRRAEFLPRWQIPANFPRDALWVAVFTYEHNFRPLVRDISAWNRTNGKPVVVLVASGKGAAGFFAAWDEAGRPFPAVQLPFLAQEDWDHLILACDFAIVRGEESLSRAVLSSVPFLWHAYLQDDGYQRVKVAALLDVMETSLGAEITNAQLRRAWNGWRALMENINDRTVNSARHAGNEDYLPTLQSLALLAPLFASFSTQIEALGDCAAGLLSLYAEMG